MKNYIFIIILSIPGWIDAQNNIAILDKDGQEVFSHTCNFMGSMSEDFALIKEAAPGQEYGAGSWGIVDLKNKKITVPPTKDYTQIGWVEKGLTVVTHRDGLAGLIDARTGKVVIPFEYMSISFLQDDLRVALSKKEFCVFDEKGNKLFCKEGKNPQISQGMISYNNGEWGDKRKAGMLRKDGTDFIPYDNDYESFSGVFHSGLMPIKKNGKYGFVNEQLELVVPYQYDFVSKFELGFSYVNSDKKYNLINTKGEKVVEKPFEKKWDFKPLSETCIKFKEGKKWGVMDKNGQIILKANYELISKFTNGYATVQDVEGNVSFIDEKGTIVFPLGQGITFGQNNNGLFSFQIDKKYGIMNFNGDEILPPEHNKIKLATDNYWIISKDGKYGLLSPEGKVLLPIEYDQIRQQVTEQDDVSFLIQKENFYGLYYNGKLIAPTYHRMGLGAAGYINVYK